MHKIAMSANSSGGGGQGLCGRVRLEGNFLTCSLNKDMDEQKQLMVTFVIYI